MGAKLQIFPGSIYIGPELFPQKMLPDLLYNAGSLLWEISGPVYLQCQEGTFVRLLQYVGADQGDGLA
jgi:hypothetical protein